MSLFVFIIFMNLLARNVQGNILSCPDAFTQVGSGCYFLSVDNQKWIDANRTCVGMGGYLVTINNAEENDIIFMWLHETHFEWNEWFFGPYIGIYNADEENNNFGWVHGSSNYTNWVDNQSPQIIGDDRCVTMTDYGQWYNYYCDEKLQYICEYTPQSAAPTPEPTSEPTDSSHILKPMKTSAPTATPTPACPTGYTWLVQNCYALVNTKKTWSAANITCADHSGWLATLSSNDETAQVTDWLDSIGGLGENMGPYIGLYRPENADVSVSKFRWSSSMDSPLPSYRHWAEGFPSFDSGAENCVHLDSDGMWINCACDNQRSFLCETSGSIMDSSSMKSKNDGSDTQSFILSLFIPLCVFVGGLLYYCCVVREKSGDSQRSWAPIGGGNGSPGPFSAMDDDNEASSAHALVGTEMMELSRFDPTDGSSPEETMEIQLQMRSYTPVHDENRREKV